MANNMALIGGIIVVIAIIAIVGVVALHSGSGGKQSSVTSTIAAPTTSVIQSTATSSASTTVAASTTMPANSATTTTVKVAPPLGVSGASNITFAPSASFGQSGYAIYSMVPITVNATVNVNGTYNALLTIYGQSGAVVYSNRSPVSFTQSKQAQSVKLPFSANLTVPGSYSAQLNITEGNQTIYQKHYGTLVPSGSQFLYSVTAISNGQSSATGSSFQQMITFNPSKYSAVETADLGNLRFYQGSNELYSWCESGCNSTSSSAAFWVLIPSGIPANGNVTVIIKTLPAGTQYDGVYAGEAPQLSSSYAKYDNGAKVFPALYQGFAGTSVPAGWNASNATIDNGASLQTSGKSTYLLTKKSFGPNASAVLDIYADLAGPATVTNLMAGYINTGGIDVLCFGWSAASHTGTAIYDFRSTSCTQATSTVGTLSSTNATYHIYSMTNPYPSNLALSYDYGAPDTSLNGFSNQSEVGIYAYNGHPIYLQWIRFRARPPNGVMPTGQMLSTGLYGSSITLT